MIVAAQVPFVPNIKALCEQIAATRNMGLKMLYLLDNAKLLNLITEKNKSYDNLVKPEKILLDNSNLMYALSSNPEIGTVRETFFVNQMAFIGQQDPSLALRNDVLISFVFLWPFHLQMQVNFIFAERRRKRLQAKFLLES